MTERPYAHTLPYWKTSTSSPDKWIDRALAVLKKLGAKDISHMFGSSNGSAAYMITFRAAGQTFRIVWPVMRLRDGDKERDGRRQAATLLYHDCKAKAVAAAAFGVEVAFVGQLVLPTGKTVEQSTVPQLSEHAKPLMLEDHS